METHFIRSKSLNNIPVKKYKDKISETLKSCEFCKEKSAENIDGLCQKCSIKITIINRYQDSNIPLEYWSLKMEKDFKGDSRLLEKYNEITKDLKDFYIKGKSFCFAGSLGVGKSFTTTSILKLAAQKGFTSLYSDLSNIVAVLTQAENDEKFNARRELCLVDFLTIDEVDPRFFANSDATNDLYIKTLESIIRTRLQNKLPTFICTNSPALTESFNGFLKQSMESLFAKFETFIVLGEDFRKKTK